ncbi:Activin types I and II receptor domain [Popillia japonica]|uniref:Serine/threonine-protein kinase receptor n=1 Tax=Popillia japonica TaxID=7064 RepID=A0AAW1IT40_POPJA
MSRTIYLLFFILLRELFIISPLVEASVPVNKLTMTCEHCNESVKCTEPITTDCPLPSEGKRNHCFVLWKLESNASATITMKGCFLNNEDCYNKSECIAKSHTPNNKLLFCCCEGNMCNQNFTWEPEPTPPPLAHEPIVEEHFPLKLVISISVGILVIVFVVAVYWYYSRRKPAFNEIPSEDASLTVPTMSFSGLRPIQLIEIKARGRFGAVWKATYKTEEVAVKIFPVQDKQSWMTEQEIYKLPHMDHPNVLHFIGAEKHSENMQVDYWLITDYHERGSLCDFLKAHTLNWSELCGVVETMARGLMHLHEEVPAKNGMKAKPSIAHRDFKSKNVLLKSNLTVCIADFGLALVFEPGKSCGDTHGQVGTRRYMAPEVLEGAINFTPDAFLRIDMYACGLVLWELVSRCTVQDGPIAEYRLPFEEEVGQHPSLEDMQESVVQRKVRPTIPQTWRNHPGLSALCDTMEECWDHDAEARLSASCFESVRMMSSYLQRC